MIAFYLIYSITRCFSNTSRAMDEEKKHYCFWRRRALPVSVTLLRVDG